MKRFTQFCSIFLASCILLAACAPATTAAVMPSPTATRTASPVVLTNTPAPTLTPSPTADPRNVCGNGPIVDWKFTPMAGQDTYVVLTAASTKGFLPNVIRSSFMTPQGVFVGGSDETEGGVFFVTPTTIESCEFNGQKVEGIVNDIWCNPADCTAILAVTDNHGAYIFGKTFFRNYTTADGLTSNDLYAIGVAAGIRYVGTWEGVNVLDPRSYDATYTTGTWAESYEDMRQGIENRIHSILFAQECGIWFASITGGISRLKSGWTYFKVKDTPALGSDNGRILAKSPDGKIWVGSDPGLATYDCQTGEWKDMARGPKPKEYGVMDIQFDTKGNAWVTGPTSTEVIRPSGGSDLFWLNGLTLALGQPGGVFDEKMVIIGGPHGLYIGTTGSEGQ